MSSKLNRRRLATEQARRWAYQAADDGEYLEAISWLRALEVIEGSLPPSLRLLRSLCVTAFGEQMQRFPHHTAEPGAPEATVPPSDRSARQALTRTLDTTR